jgi:hypothetical protein
MQWSENVPAARCRTAGRARSVCRNFASAATFSRYESTIAVDRRRGSALAPDGSAEALASVNRSGAQEDSLGSTATARGSSKGSKTSTKAPRNRNNATRGRLKIWPRLFGAFLPARSGPAGIPAYPFLCRAARALQETATSAASHRKQKDAGRADRYCQGARQRQFVSPVVPRHDVRWAWFRVAALI